MTRHLARPRRTLGAALAVVAALGWFGLNDRTAASAANVPKQRVPWAVDRLTADERAAMTPSVWRRGCPVSLSDIRRVTVRHHAPDGSDHIGAIDVHRQVADDVVEIFRELYDSGFVITSVIPIEAFGGDDDRSVDADNTSGFNCRPTYGGRSYSRHAYGRAIDLNPFRNPYVVKGTAQPRPGVDAFVRRSDVAGQPGVIVAGGAVVRIFNARGWRWGGEWSDPVDYQHFDRR